MSTTDKIAQARAWVEEYLEGRALDLAPKTIIDYRADLAVFLTCIAPIDPTEASSADITNWLVSRTRAPGDPSDGKLWCRATSSRRLAAIRGWYDWLMDQGHVAKNPAARIRIRVPLQPAPLRYSAGEIGSFFAAGRAAILAPQNSKKHGNAVQHYAICVLAFTFALRVEEVLSLTRGSLDRWQKPWRLTVARKGGKQRTFTVPDGTDVHNSLTAALAVQKLPSTPETPLFYSLHTGRRWTRRTVLRVMGQWAAAAGWDEERLDAWSPHALRHSRAYLMVEEGRSVQDIKDLLDHASLATTTRYVQHDERAGNRLLLDEVHRPLPSPDLASAEKAAA